jgi:O-antigen ligase
MSKTNLYGFCAFISLALLFCLVVIHLQFVVLPVVFLALGFASHVWNGRKALTLFLFLLPLVNSTPDLFFNGYPFNYMGIPLFYLSGILCASRLKKEKPMFIFPGQGVYLLFLALVAVSVFFVFLRWFNLNLSWLALARDTPVTPSGARVSFAAIFPIMTLALFALSPYLAVLLRRGGFEETEVFNPLRAGFFISFLIALVQRWLNPDLLAQSWWRLRMKQVNGGFSDFNAFGFFAGVLFLYQALLLLERLPIAAFRGWKARAYDAFFLLITLAAIFLSGCRTAFIFVLLALFGFLVSKKIGFFTKMAGICLLAVSLLVAGGTLSSRLSQTLAQVTRAPAGADWAQAADRISNGRITMLKDSLRMIGRFPISGIGAGNFLFYREYLYFGKDFYEDLPLNQYLLTLTETGLPGGLLFIFFLAILLKRQRPGSRRFILAAMALALLFNNFFWFPEAMLLFWIFVSRTDVVPAPERKIWVGSSLVLLLLFIVSNAVDFHALHPKTMARTVSSPFNYGLFYQENENGRPFRWTGEKAGIYIYLDRNGRSSAYRLFCGAPLSAFKGRQQVVDIYWRGKFFKQVVFRKNVEYPFLIEDKTHNNGFLEFRVRPAFNLKRMGRGEETRDLGVQVSDEGV